MRLLTIKIIAHVLLTFCAFIMLCVAFVITSGINQYIFAGLIALFFILANAWIAVSPEYDYRGNP